MSIADKLTTVAENVPKVYKAGQDSMVDESKIVPKTVSGTSISVNDVSEIPHSVSCKVESINLFQPTRSSFTSYTGITLTRRNEDSYRVHGTATSRFRVSLGAYRSESASAFYISGGTQDMPLSVDLRKGNTYKRTAVNSGGVLVIPNESHEFDEVDICLLVGEGETVDAIVKPMVSLYDHSTYTPYVPPESVKVIKYGADENEGYQELTPNADGTVDGIKSTSPYMNIKTDTEGVVFNVTYHKSWGMQTEYDRVWDDLQQNGNRSNYQYAFYRTCWKNGTTYNPKYPIVCSTNNYATYMFGYSGVSDTVVPITIKCTSGSVFSGNSNLVTIRKLIVDSKTTSYNDWFTSCSKLANIEVEGEIVASLTFQYSPLTAKSMVSIVEHLSDTVSGKTLTFNSTAVANADWSTTDYSSFEELVATKTDWNIGV